jgi:LacI family transcriptional regulator
MGTLKSLHENALKVPEDVEVFGYDNLYMSQFMQPRLSTVDIPKSHLGRSAVEELVRHIKDGERPYKNIYLQPRLVYRETTPRRH